MASTLIPNSLPADRALDAALAAFHAKVAELRSAGVCDVPNPMHAILARIVVGNMSAALETGVRHAAETVLLVAAALTERADDGPVDEPSEPNDEDDQLASLRVVLGDAL